MNKKMKYWSIIALRFAVFIPLLTLINIGLFAEKVSDWADVGLPRPVKGD